MPEGDTIHRAAAGLRPVLQGAPLVALRAPRLRHALPAPGAIIDRVEARGKHLLMHFQGGLVLHTHMRMTGSWHVYRRGEPWRKSPKAARVVLETQEAVAVCFAAPVVELLDERSLRRHPTIRSLGPDLCLPDPDLDRCLDRMARLPEPNATIADVLLDQRIGNGIGNVYKSEVTFLHRLHPATPLHLVDVATRRDLLATAADLLQANVSTTARTTVPGAVAGSVWVYDRAGKPCRRDDTPIVQTPIGPHARLTYWCPTCLTGDV